MLRAWKRIPTLIVAAHDATIGAISEVIQLAVAPVFLLTGIAGILAVLTVRLGRLVGRARLVDRLISRIESDD